MRRQLIRRYVDGMNLRRIARQLGVVHQTMANWFAAYAATLPMRPPNATHNRQHPLPVVEYDELYILEAGKEIGSGLSPKQTAPPAVSSPTTSPTTASRAACTPCSIRRLQPASTIPTNRPPTPTLSPILASMRRCPTRARPTRWKGTTLRRGTIWRGWRARSRCFTRSLQALRDAVKLFVYAWNRRQLYRRKHSKYAAHVFQFVYP